MKEKKNSFRIRCERKDSQKFHVDIIVTKDTYKQCLQEILIQKMLKYQLGK